MPNSYSMASSSIVSQQWKGHGTTSEATGKNALEKYDLFYIIDSGRTIMVFPYQPIPIITVHRYMSFSYQPIPITLPIIFPNDNPQDF